MIDDPRRRPRSRRSRRRRRRAGRVGIAAEQTRLKVAAFTFGGVVLIGLMGYQVIEHASFLDSLYMTVITITTVGFREVVEPSAAGQVLTMFLIVAGFGSASYAAITGAEFIVDGHLRTLIERRRMSREIEALRGHVIVCGFGRVGRHLVNQLLREAQDFVVIDENDDKILELQDLDYLYIRGDASEEHVLEEAGLDHARALVACVNSDADNVLITLTAKGLRPSVTVISRVKADETEAKMRRAGADRVIAPATIGGRRIAQILTRPTVADFLDRLGGGAVDYTLEEVPVTEGSPLDGSTLREAAIRERYGCTVVAIRHGDNQELESHPSATSTLHPGDVILVMGNELDVTALRRRFLS